MATCEAEQGAASYIGSRAGHDRDEFARFVYSMAEQVAAE